MTTRFAIASTSPDSASAIPPAPPLRRHGPSPPPSGFIGHISSTLGRYKSVLATTDADRDAACRLRFHVFNAELGEGLIQSYATGRDRDKFDQVCDHLIVKDTQTNLVVGTYRMQSGPVAAAHFGYYSQQEFQFTPYEPIRPQILELGRACIHKDHRNSEVLTLLWRTIATYCRFHGLRYLVGCSSLTSRDPGQGWALYHQLQDFLAATELRTTVLPGYQLPLRADHSSTHVKIPKLLRSYIGAGARICSQPAWDRDFGTIDFLTLLDLDQLAPAARNRFLTSTQ